MCVWLFLQPYSATSAILQPSTEIGQSIADIYPNYILSHPNERPSEHSLLRSRSFGRVSLRKQLAEAAGKEVLSESDDDSGAKADDEEDGLDEEEFREMSIPEKLKAIFGLPVVEELKAGEPRVRV